MGSVTKISAAVELNDEFANFDVREEVERQLEIRLTEHDLDARPALKAFEPSADDDQLSLIHESHRAIRLIAPAGSGKAQKIINRALHLTKKDPARSASSVLRSTIPPPLRCAKRSRNSFQPFRPLTISSLSARSTVLAADSCDSIFHRNISRLSNQTAFGD
jgi:hypothetical protein